jgi:hypothetical protein
VIRTGYGVFFNVNMMNMFVPALAANPPNNLNINQLNSAGAVVIRMRTADQASALNINSEINSADTKRGVGDVQQWNFNIQRMLPKAVLVEVGYMGSKSAHFDSPRTVNPYAQGTTTRIYPAWGPIENISLDASGTYHGLLMKAEKRMSQGITFLQTYTFSKTMFDSFACCGAQRHNNPYAWKLEKGLAETDQRPPRPPPRFFGSCRSIAANAICAGKSSAAGSSTARLTSRLDSPCILRKARRRLTTAARAATAGRIALPTAILAAARGR